MTSLDFHILTRRPDEHRPDCWRIWCGDICAGWIAKAPTTGGQSEWQWSAGFYPGSGPGGFKHGCAGTFEEVKANFLPSWRAFAERRTHEDFEEWRDQRDFTAWKYRMRDQGMPMPTQSHTGRARCFCGAEITTARVVAHIRAEHREIGT